MNSPTQIERHLRSVELSEPAERYFDVPSARLMSICHIRGDKASDGFLLVASHDGRTRAMLATSCAPSRAARMTPASTRRGT
jgi:hypothetical protein